MVFWRILDETIQKHQEGRVKGDVNTIGVCNATTRHKNDGDWRIRFQVMKHVEAYLVHCSLRASDTVLLCCYLLYLLPLIYIFHVLTASSDHMYVYVYVCVCICMSGFVSVSVYVIFLFPLPYSAWHYSAWPIRLYTVRSVEYSKHVIICPLNIQYNIGAKNAQHRHQSDEGCLATISKIFCNNVLVTPPYIIIFWYGNVSFVGVV